MLPTFTHICISNQREQSLNQTDVKTDPRQRRIGNANKENVQQALSALALYPFTRRLGMTANAVNDLVDKARADAANPNLKAYFPL